jgi:hypothetical protein
LKSRHVLQTLAVLAVAFAFTSPAFAGGGGGGTKSKVNVRTKNFTSDVVNVGVKNKGATPSRALNPDGIAQFKVNKGGYQVNQDGDVVGLNTGNAKTVYIALTDVGPEQTSTKF